MELPIISIYYAIYGEMQWLRMASSLSSPLRAVINDIMLSIFASTQGYCALKTIEERFSISLPSRAVVMICLGPPLLTLSSSFLRPGDRRKALLEGADQSIRLTAKVVNLIFAMWLYQGSKADIEGFKTLFFLVVTAYVTVKELYWTNLWSQEWRMSSIGTIRINFKYPPLENILA